jgi:hypothetical protein
MAGGIQFRIEEGEGGRLQAQLDQMPNAVKRRLETVIRQLTDELLSQVRARMPARTGHLRSLTHSYVDVRENFVRGRVRVADSRHPREAVIAGALEYGAPGRRRGRVPVRAHRMRLTHLFGRPFRGGSVTVRSFSRKRPTISEMRFLRGPAVAMRPKALAAIRDAINQPLRFG